MIAFLSRLGIAVTRFSTSVFGSKASQAIVGNLALLGTTQVGSWLSNLLGSDDDENQNIVTIILATLGGLTLILVGILLYKFLKKK